MPVHDWARVPADVFLHFRLCWLVDLRTRVNQLLPADSYALMVPDPFDTEADPARPVPGRRAVAVFHQSGRRVAVIDIPPPDTTARAKEIDRYARQAAGQLELGVNVLLIDVFPQTGQHAQRVADTIWALISSKALSSEYERPLTIAAFATGQQMSAYVEFLSAGDSLPDMPVFIGPDVVVPAPLEASSVTAFDGIPHHFREALTAPAGGGGAADGT